jgi:hypothetical protein
MSDGTTLEEIEQNNVLCWRRFREYWRQQGVNVDVTDPTKPITGSGFVAGLPRGYRGEDAIRVRGLKASERQSSE